MSVGQVFAMLVVFSGEEGITRTGARGEGLD